MNVVVTTEYRGVFFGEIDELPADNVRVIVLANCRNCIYWSAATRGFLGLAANGPADESRIGPAVKSVKLYGVTSVALCTDEAAEQWRLLGDGDS